MTKFELHLKPIYRFEYCSWTHNDKICEFIHQERDFITKDESCKGSRTKLNFVGKTFKKKNAIYYGNNFQARGTK